MFARANTVTEDYWKARGYRVAQVLRRVTQIFVQRSDEGDGLRVEFVDYETMPHTDVSLVVPCASAELGLYVVGSVAYELGLWLQQRTLTVEAFIALESPARVAILAHRERGRDVVLLMEPSDAAGAIGED